MEKGIEELRKYLPQGWESAARERGALLRSRGIKTAAELLEVILLYLTVGESYGGTATLLNLTTEKIISKQAVYKRIIGSWEWLRWMCKEMSSENGMIMPKPDWLERELITVDGSEMGVKGSKQGDYRLHMAFDIFNFTYRTIEITDIKEGEKLSRHMVRAGDIILADRLYGNIQGMEHVVAGGGDFILRYRTKGFHVYDENGEKLSLIERFRGLSAMESTSVECFYYSEGKKRPVRLVAMRKDEEAIQAAHRKMKKKLNKQRGKAPSQEALDFNEYIVLATTLDYSNERILELYRARWQIEQVFLRLKEIFQFGEVPAKRDDAVKAWFYGKLFLALLSETIMKKECFSPEKEILMRSSSGCKLMENP